MVFRAIQKEWAFYKNGTQKYKILIIELKNENVYPNKARSNWNSVQDKALFPVGIGKIR